MHLALILQLCQTPAKVATHSSRPNHRNLSHSFHALLAANQILGFSRAFNFNYFGYLAVACVRTTDQQPAHRDETTKPTPVAMSAKRAKLNHGDVTTTEVRFKSDLHDKRVTLAFQAASDPGWRTALQAAAQSQVVHARVVPTVVAFSYVLSISLSLRGSPVSADAMKSLNGLKPSYTKCWPTS